MTDTYRLIYTSRSLLGAVEETRVAAVAEILARSQAHNAHVGVTGALLFNGGCFAQVLEGRRDAVEATFERIQRDPRHRDVAVLQCEPVAERGFPHWSMGFVGRSARGRALWSEIASRTGFDPGRIAGDALFATLHAIMLEDEGVATSRPPPEPPDPGPAPRRRDPERVTALDVVKLRSELAAVTERGPARPHTPPPPVAPPCPAAAAPEGIEVAVLRAALDEERARVTALRGELDGARLALALAADRTDALRRRGDIWAGRARALAAALSREPDEAREPPETAGRQIA